MVSLEQKLIKAELIQRREEGCQLEDIEPRISDALERKASDEEFHALYEELMALPIPESSAYIEPSTLEQIHAQRPHGPRRFDCNLDDDQLYNRIYGAWLGRAAGCALGKPVEGWPKARIDGYLAEMGIEQLDDYIPFHEKKIPSILKTSTRGNIAYMDRDDDMDFPILGLLALERKGHDFSARTMAHIWLEYMPFSTLYTAENVAYRNFVMSLWPPESASFRNPFREWIGAQIRADIFGYVAPGNPEKAAHLAFFDASISHEKNGIYGEMFVAAMLAAAFVVDDIEEIIAIGLSEIPQNSRLTEAVKDTLAWCQQETDWEHIWQKIHDKYGHYHGVHTVNNAALVVMGLMLGAQDYEKGITTTVRAGWDTDCTAATVGSILGVMRGADGLPEKWIEVFNDRLVSAVRTENENRISDLAKRTLVVAKELEKQPDRKDPATLTGEASGVWELDSPWGAQVLNLTEGWISWAMEEVDDMKLTSCSFQNPELKFGYGIPKGSWDFEVDFVGTIDGDEIEGVYYPDTIFNGTVKGRRVA